MKRLAAVVALAAAAGGCPVDPAHLPQMTFAIPQDKDWPTTPLAPAPGPGEGRIYVTDNLDDTISIVDLDSAEAGTPKLVAKVPVGFVPVEREGPHHVSADQAGEFYYFGISNFVPASGSGPHGQHGAGTIDGHMVKMSVADNTLVAEVRVEPNPGDVRLTPDGKTLLASHFDLVKIGKALSAGITSGPEIDSDLAIIDPVTMTRRGDNNGFVDLCPASHGVVITPDSALAITSCFDDEIAFVDLVGDAHTVTKVPILEQPGTADSPVCEPYSVTLDGDTAWVSCFNFVGNFGEGPIIGVDIPTRTRTGKALVLQTSSTAVFGDVKDGIMVIAHQSASDPTGDGFAFFDVTADPPAPIIDMGVNGGDCRLPHVARFNDDGSKVFAVCEGDHTNPGSFLVIDAAAHTVIGKVDLGIYPDDIAIMRRPR